MKKYILAFCRYSSLSNDIGTFPALLAFSAGNPLITNEFSYKGRVMQKLDVFCAVISGTIVGWYEKP